MTSASPSVRGKALSFERRNDTIEVELHREPCNEIGTTALDELEKLAAFLREGADGARALVIYSSMTKGFCAGADLRELHRGILDQRARGGDRNTIATEARAFVDRIHDVFDTIDGAPITTIAAVHGFCFGGGFELALTCDVIIAERSARFCFPELRLGLIPGFGGLPRLKRDVGNMVIRDLLLTGRSLGAARAYELGLVSQLVANGEGLGVARLVAEQAARFDARTTAVAKSFAKPFPRDELAREKEIFIELMTSPEVEHALASFVERTDARPYLP